MPQSEILIREPVLGDAPHLIELWVDRKYDSEPGYRAFSDRRIEEVRGNISYAENWIRGALEQPEEFLNVATIGSAVVGFCRAQAPPNAEYCAWDGITVSRQHQGTGVAGYLEDARMEWSRQFGRPLIQVKIVPGNVRSERFFQKRGFKKVGEQAPSADLPLRFNIFQLELA